MNIHRLVLTSAPWLVAIALVGCSGIDSPTQPGESSLRFQPAQRSLLVAKGSSTLFAVRDQDGKILPASFYVNGDFKRHGDNYAWVAPAAGEYLIKVEVDFESRTESAYWSIEVRDVDFDYVPPVTELSAEPGTVWGSVLLHWDRPEVPVLYPTIVSYQIYHAQFPFISISQDGVETFSQNDVSSQRQQSATINNQNPLGQVYTKIVAISATGGRSLISGFAIGWPLGPNDYDIPAPTGVSLELPEEFETLILHWTEPTIAPSSPPIDHYDVYWSTTAFYSPDVPGVESTTVNAESSTMSLRLENLLGDTDYFCRVQAFDATGTPSAFSGLVSRRTPITPTYFTLSGQLLEVDLAGLQLLPHAGATFTAGPTSAQSDVGGNWILPTYTQGQLTLELAPNGDFYGAQTGIVLDTDQQLDFVLIPKRTVQIVDSGGGLDGPMSEMEFFHRFTSTRVHNDWNPTRLYRWEQYPVEIQKSTLVRQGNGEMVDYGMAFETAVDTWNGMIGRDLLVLVDHDPSYGVSVAVDIPMGGASLGETKFVVPANGWWTDSIPEKLAIHLTQFNYQALANRVILHELGHVLSLFHSPSDEHVMGNGAPNFPLTEDEARIARIISLLPQGTPLSWYLEE